ncbi:hypothetical protein [Staphylothermus hellenicus]|uniref:Cren protein n=1 Tax=Staphylothermus hellenicus (strain DSM 12710 / JCM 10830 / BK20S6-10-b1 / P8) TaxID=591019 RepID=D7D9J4_STAHD|nr:hypothetical protein [Staphylothermus hellenicus]ADI32440.1 hypothetical protein Shell_1348 [Staphylothermus hellenicus DSM 12710]
MEIEKVIPIKLNSLNDLVRLAATISSPQTTMYILRFKYKNKLVLGVLGVFRDYYKLYGLPMFYYYILKKEDAEKIIDKSYIIISSNNEKIEFSKHPKPGLSIPMITLAKKPLFIPELD